MEVFAQGLRPNTDCDDLSEAPGVLVDAVVCEPFEVLDEDFEPVDVEAYE